jgi:flagellar biosynthetic protein FlhB
MADDQDQKTEQPTGKRLTDAAERGQFPHVQELQVLFTLIAVLLVLGATARPAVDRLTAFAVGIFTRFPSMVVRPETVPSLLMEIMLTLGPVILPVLLACSGAALLAGGLQSGFRLSPKALEPQWSRLNPIDGFERLFGQGVWVRVGIDFLKILAVGGTLYLGARKLLYDPLFSAPIEIAYLGTFLNQTVVTFFGRMLFALAVIAALRYAHEWRKTRQQLMMTREEVKEEHKAQELDSKLKAAQRRLARRLLQKQMLSAVATADVIVTNPTHYAVALSYQRGQDRAPIVLAKGENRFAQRLKAIAAEHGVPTIENKPVARLLYAMGRVGEAIPPELYQAVAEILAVVYRTHRYYFHRLRARRIEETAA